MTRELLEQGNKLQDISQLATGTAAVVESYLNTNDDKTIRIEIGEKQFFLNKKEPLDKIMLDAFINAMYQAKDKYAQMFAEL